MTALFGGFLRRRPALGSGLGVAPFGRAHLAWEARLTASEGLGIFGARAHGARASECSSTQRSSKERARTARLSKVTALIPLAFALAYTAATLWFARAFAHFWGDDLSTLASFESQSFFSVLFTHRGGQFVPLHQAVYWGLRELAPMSYPTALAILAAFHLLATLYLYKTLELLRPSRLNVTLVALYLMHPFAGVNFLWFASGLTRYPYIACSMAALFHYLAFIRSGRLPHLGGVVMAYVIGLGFYSKTIFVPLYLAGAEAAAISLSMIRPARGTLRFRVITMVGLLSAGLVYGLIAREALDPEFARVNGDLWSIARIVGASILTFLQTTIAWELHQSWSVLGTTIVGVLLLSVVWAVLREPRTLVAWGALFGLVAVNIGLIGASSRTLFFGDDYVIRHYRYYYELWFLIIVFAKMGFCSVAFRRRTVLLPAVVLSFALYGFESLRGLGFVASTELWYAAKSRAYIENLQRGLDQISKAHRPPTFRDGRIPRFLNPLDLNFTSHSDLFAAMGVEARFTKRRRARYRVNREGNVVDRWNKP